MNNTIIAWLINLLSSVEQEEMTDNMLKTCFLHGEVDA